MTEHTSDSLKQIGAQWIARLRQSEIREEQWVKDAKAAENAYLAGQADDDGQSPEWNILHSNVETIVPSIYNSTPAPDIRPRASKQDQLTKDVADVFERAIATQIDDNRLDREMELLAQDAFVAGRGVVRVKFDADVEDIVEEYDDGSEEITGQRVVNERLIFENVAWRDYREGPAKRWSEMPWVAFRHFISEAELNKIKDEEMWAAQQDSDRADPEGEEKDVDVWEIWCRNTGRVYFVVDKTGMVASMEDDPMGLPEFFPMAEPVQPIMPTGGRIPVCPYSIYKKQAEELNQVSRRIKAITSGLKVRGGIASSAEAVQDIARAGDNELIPIADVEGLVATGGISNAIVWWPIDAAVAVLRELYVAREQIKASIYEITGISDIIRGNGAASETATAQQIKTEWGSLRIKKSQRLVERQVRDLFVISADIMSRHFSPQSLLLQSGVQSTPELMQALASGLDHYRIDVESDSTVRADTSKRRGEMARFLEGTAQFFSVMAPLAAEAPESAGVIAEIYGSFAQQFSLGKSAEDSIGELVEMARQKAQQPQAEPGDQAAQMEAKIKQADMQLRQQELLQNGKLEAEKLRLEGQRLQLERVKAASEMQGVMPPEMAALAASGGVENMMAPIIGQLQQANAMQNEALAQIVERMGARDEMIVRALQAPERVIRDGMSVGVEMVGQ